MVPWRWEEPETGTFAQRFVRRTRPFKQFCKDHELVTILQSEGDKDANSEHPVCLYRESGDAETGGGLVVMDLDAMGAAGGCEDAAKTTAHVLFNALGERQSCIGQYVVPARTLAELATTWKELQEWYPEVVVETLAPAPARGPRWQVTLGREGESFGAMGPDRPAVLVRTGFCSEDWAGMYGVWLWLKQLIRPEPYRSRYASALAGRHRVVWYPVVRPDLWFHERPSAAVGEPA